MVMTQRVISTLALVLAASFGLGRGPTSLGPPPERLTFRGYANFDAARGMTATVFKQAAAANPDWWASNPRVAQLEQPDGSVVLYVARMKDDLEPGASVKVTSNWEYLVQTASVPLTEPGENMEMHVVDLIELASSPGP